MDNYLMNHAASTVGGDISLQKQAHILVLSKILFRLSYWEQLYLSSFGQGKTSQLNAPWPLLCDDSLEAQDS